MWASDPEQYLQIMYNFMNTSSHLRWVVIGTGGASVALCGAKVAGYFRQRFLSIHQLSGKRGCEDCRKEYMKIVDERGDK